MAAPFVFSTTGRTVLDPTRSHLTASLHPAVPRSSTAPYAPAQCVDNKSHYTVKGVGWDRWADERWSDRADRQWMGDIKHAPTAADKQATLGRSRQYREYALQQQHFSHTAPTAAATSGGDATAALGGTSTATSYAAIGSHYRSSLSVGSTAAIEPPSTLNTSTFESSSKRLGLDPSAAGSYLSCYGADYKEPAADGGEQGSSGADVLGASYALGYGRNHRHHRMAVNRTTTRGNGSSSAKAADWGEEAKEQLEATERADASGEVKVERLAQGLGYAQGHVNYYKYLRSKDPRVR